MVHPDHPIAQKESVDLNDLFGSAAYDKLLGIMTAVNYAGLALGATLINLCYGVMGSYKPIFLIFGLMMVLNCIAFQFAISRAHKQREKALAGNKE